METDVATERVYQVSRSRHRLPNVDIPVESRLYSDGLFSFTVYVSPTDGRALHE
ncbi:MAG: MucB/RseB C-terminal domain-containing protein, partial [Plesiomonas sp.]